MKTEKVEVDRLTVEETQDLILPVDSYVEDEISQFCDAFFIMNDFEYIWHTEFIRIV